MPATRRSQRAQRLSDYFPAVDAPSPIVASTPTTRRAKRTKATSTPAVQTRDTKEKRKDQLDTKTNLNTTTFNPDLHVVASDSSDDSAEDEFAKTITYSAAKAKKSLQDAPAPKQAMTHDYEVVVDYDSDSDAFAFSPVKFTPSSSSAKRPLRAGNGTPAPVKKTSQATKMVWNSEKKRVEPRIIEVPVSSVAMAPTEARSQGSSDASRLDSNDPDSSAGSVSELHLNSDSDEEAETDINSADEAGINFITEHVAKRLLNRITKRMSERLEQPPIRSKTNTPSTDSRSVQSPLKASIDQIKTSLQKPHESMDSHDVSTVADHSAESIPVTKNRRQVSEAVRSPRVQLTRAVAGSQGMRLEKIPVPASFLSSGSDTERKRTHQYQPYARLPQKPRLDAPDASVADTAQGLQQQPRTSISAAKAVSADESAPRQANCGYQTQPCPQTHLNSPRAGPPTRQKEVEVVSRRKRKTSDADGEPQGLQSPAKRVKLAPDAITRPVARPRAARQPAATQSSSTGVQRSGGPVNRHTSGAKATNTTGRSAIDIKRQQGAGVVPWTLYSPEKYARPNKAPGPTRPAPFKFSTDARAARSPAVATKPPPSKVNSAALPGDFKKPSITRVSALQAIPFIPKPSDHPSTVAASPARQLPSRLKTRKEFDKVAEKHAEEVLQRKKKQELELAAERERRMDERQGWRDSGKAAIEQWASKANANASGTGKRDWID